ncbi:putative single strand-annealing protein [Pelagibacter phage HTVC035P]|jgi:hypothetical protein|nr:putative single strand-annealing protein [Pelagibacter phage HTVC035P]|tara:strand:+ start:618 stop:1304 length:687 start_codon:yes stop_codon:yes gene_type:complete
MGYKNMKNQNMKIWDFLSKTNPEFTKPFSKFGGKTLTTIDPHYQIQMMTNAFGPVGKGWSYQVEYKYLDKLVFAEVSIQYFLDNKWYAFGPVSSVQSLAKKNGGLDDEAPKKAMTDAMTKAFSHLGMSADVFLGMFENNKYVEDLKKEFSQKQNSVVQTTEPAYMDDTVDVDEIKNEISAAKTEKQFYAVKNKLRLKVNYLKNNNFKAYEQIRDYTRKHEATLTNNQQ